jgi:hypothetical protein
MISFSFTFGVLIVSREIFAKKQQTIRKYEEIVKT